MYATTITRSNQITITRPAREFLGVKPGEKLDVTFSKGALIVKRHLPDAEFFAQLDAVKSAKTKAAMKKHAGKSMAEIRKSDAYKKHYEEVYAR